MNKKFNQNLFIKELSKSITDIIYESIGTLQLNNDESKLINQIYDDINNKRYNKLNILDYNDIPQIQDETDVYSLKYNIQDFNKEHNTHIDWILNLEIIVTLSDNSNYVNAAALLDNDKRTIFSDSNIIYACIVINNPEHERFPKNYIAHELNHYYSEFNRYKKTKLYPVYSDIDINVNYQHYNIDFSNIELAKFQATTNNAYLKSILIECLYWLNESEIKAHIEDIYYELEQNLNKNICKSINDISKYSETLQYYMNIDKLLNITYKNLTVEQKQYLNRTLIPLFNLNRTFNKNKRLNIDYVYKKMFNKIKKIYKHIHRIYVYLHEL